MNILFDFLTFRTKTGAGEFGRSILYELLSKIKNNKLHKVYALYDSNYGISYEDLTKENLTKQNDVTFIDCKNDNITNITKKYNIDKFFISCGHYFQGKKDIIGVQCETICVIHDLYGEDNVKNKIYHYMDLIEPDANEQAIFRFGRLLRKIPFFRSFLHKIDKFGYDYICSGGIEKYSSALYHIKPAIELIKSNPNCKIITVSEYSKYSICYNFKIPIKNIHVLYSPERLYIHQDTTKNAKLERLISQKTKYYLMVSASRKAKNPYKVINAFKQYCKINTEAFLVTVGNIQSQFENHICLPFLEDNDLDLAYKNCYALIFPSFYEGFGYPPLEAMRHGKPILCSNTTSMPEIYEDAPIYFSPFYESGIFKSLFELTDDNYTTYSEKSLCQYHKIKNRQTKDLQKIIKLILSPKHLCS